MHFLPTPAALRRGDTLQAYLLFSAGGWALLHAVALPRRAAMKTWGRRFRRCSIPGPHLSPSATTHPPQGSAPRLSGASPKRPAALGYRGVAGFCP